MMSIKIIFRKIFIHILNKFDIIGFYTLRRFGPLYEDGWFRSHREQSSVNLAGEPIPWITYPAIDFIRKRLKPDMAVFEFGSGGSTKWWGRRVRRVLSVEHDLAWYESVSSSLDDNINIVHIALEYDGDYSKYILNYFECFDVVVIDGRDRVNCIKNCLRALTSNGVVILDNSDRPQYKDGVDFLLLNGFKKIEFIGLCPIVNFKSETAVFYRTLNVFGI
jgi:hypothetical protein